MPPSWLVWQRCWEQSVPTSSTLATWDEYDRLQQEGAVFEGLVLDPVFRLGWTVIANELVATAMAVPFAVSPTVGCAS